MQIPQLVSFGLLLLGSAPLFAAASTICSDATASAAPPDVQLSFKDVDAAINRTIQSLSMNDLLPAGTRIKPRGSEPHHKRQSPSDEKEDPLDKYSFTCRDNEKCTTFGFALGGVFCWDGKTTMRNPGGQNSDQDLEIDIVTGDYKFTSSGVKGNFLSGDTESLIEVMRKQFLQGDDRKTVGTDSEEDPTGSSMQPSASSTQGAPSTATSAVASPKSLSADANSGAGAVVTGSSMLLAAALAATVAMAM